jgi:hypothetical protein
MIAIVAILITMFDLFTFMFIYGAGKCNKAYDEMTELEFNNKGNDSTGTI